MRLTKKKLLKNTVAKVMAVAMAVTMVPVPAAASADSSTTTDTNSTGQENSDNATPSEKANDLPIADSAGVIKLERDTELTTDIKMSNWSASTSDNRVLDLAGHTLSFTGLSRIEIDNGSLTIRDSSGNNSGKIDGTTRNDDNTSDNVTKSALISVSGNGSEVTFEGGTIDTTGYGGYGILASNGSDVYIKGGIINSKYSTVSNNNTLKSGNFYISGGTLTSIEGPCIYKASPGNLYIGTDAKKDTPAEESLEDTTTDNIKITGGISARMGNIKITGGYIKGLGNNIESPASPDKYNQRNGSPSFADALFVLGGTYEGDESSSGSGAVNDLTLTITGGKFETVDEKGSPVTIYDFAKVQQKTTINISGGEFINGTGKSDYLPSAGTNDKSNDKRKSFDILPLNEILPDDAALQEAKNNNYANENINNIKDDSIKITGGEFHKGVASKYVKSLDEPYCSEKNQVQILAIYKLQNIVLPILRMKS